MPETAGPPEALIFDVQRFSIHDGPGLRTTVFFKGCSMRCRWCQNPESHSSSPEMAFYAELCERCFRCDEACPAGAIVDEASRRIERSRCDACALCAEACPNNALRLVGRSWKIDELVPALLRDRDFFEDSGGGVTLSGGEPLLQAGFVAELCGVLKDEAVKVLVETAGQCDALAIDALAGLVDLVYFDFKLASSVEHERLTGMDNRAALRSLSRFLELGFAVQPRMPVVPGANDDEENIRGTAAYLRGLGLSSIHCLPYHALGLSKLPRLGSRQEPFAAITPSSEDMKRVGRLFKEEGIDAVIYA
jgi:pyruvate formate lyase activating enzyme